MSWFVESLKKGELEITDDEVCPHAHSIPKRNACKLHRWAYRKWMEQWKDAMSK